jgi:hypothetical protein
VPIPTSIGTPRPRLRRFTGSLLWVPAVPFLDWWRDQGWFLDDLCAEPVNHLDDSPRRRHHRLAESSLTRRLGWEPQPAIVLFTPLMIQSSVLRVVKALDWKVQVGGLHFPSHGSQHRFQDELMTWIVRTDSDAG